jgi:hypothetical protein
MLRHTETQLFNNQCCCMSSHLITTQPPYTTVPFLFTSAYQTSYKITMFTTILQLWDLMTFMGISVTVWTDAVQSGIHCLHPQPTNPHIVTSCTNLHCLKSFKAYTNSYCITVKQNCTYVTWRYLTMFAAAISCLYLEPQTLVMWK